MDNVHTPPRAPTAGFDRWSGGFTLVEMVMAIVLLGVLAAVGSTMIADTANTTRITNSSLTSLSQARYAVERMAREIREVQNVSGTYTIPTRTLTNMVFTKNDGVVVNINNSGVNLTLGSSTLTNQVDTAATPPFELRYLNITGGPSADNIDIRFVEITLNVKNPDTGVASTQRTRVALRNTQ